MYNKVETKEKQLQRKVSGWSGKGRSQQGLFSLAKSRLEEDMIAIFRYVRKMGKRDWKELAKLKGIVGSKQMSLDE